MSPCPIGQLTQYQCRCTTNEVTIKAIDWAISAEVDIISVSGIVYEQNSALENAVSRATTLSHIVLICSEPVEGKNRQHAYPFSYNTVVKIGNATPWGTEAEGSDHTKVTHAFQGERIVVKTPAVGGDGLDEMSGASVATAIAAGVASLVLACYRMALLRAPSMKRDSMTAVNKDILNSVFKKMKNGNDKYVQPKKLFKEDVYGGPDTFLRWLYTNLISG